MRHEARGVGRRLPSAVALLLVAGCFHNFSTSGGAGSTDGSSSGDRLGLDAAAASAVETGDAFLLDSPVGGASGAVDGRDATASTGAAGSGGPAETGGAGSIGTSTGGSGTGGVERGGTGGSGGTGNGGMSVLCPASTDGQPLPFIEGFEAYPSGPLVDAAGSPWVRASQGRAGNVSTSWVHSGAQNLEIYSFSTSTEVHYVPLEFQPSPARIDIELWYAPDGYFVYKDFATFGLGCARSKFDLSPVLAVVGNDHKLVLLVGGTQTELDNEVDYGSAAFPYSAPAAAIQNYLRLEFDFAAGQLRTFVGPTASAPLKSTVDLPSSLTFNAFFVSGGLNPTYLDDISITSQ